MSLESKLNSSSGVFLVQDKLFRVWGKVVLQRDTESICEGRFEALPDFRYLRGRFAEYQSLIGETGSNFFEIAAMNQKAREIEASQGVKARMKFEKDYKAQKEKEAHD